MTAPAPFGCATIRACSAHTTSINCAFAIPPNLNVSPSDYGTTAPKVPIALPLATVGDESGGTFFPMTHGNYGNFPPLEWLRGLRDT